MAANPTIVLTEQEEASIKKISVWISNLFICCKDFKTKQKTQDRVVALLAEYYAALAANSDFERMMLLALKAHNNYSQFDTLCAMILYADRRLSTPDSQSLSEKLVKEKIIGKSASAMEQVLNTIQPHLKASSEPPLTTNIMEVEVASETPAEAQPCTADNANFNLTMFGGLCKIGLGAALIVAGVVLGIGLMVLGIPSGVMGCLAGASVMWALGSVGALGVVSGLEDCGFFARSDDSAAGNKYHHPNSSTLKRT